MNLIRRRLFACVLAVMLCMAAFPISAFARSITRIIRSITSSPTRPRRCTRMET